MGVTDFPTVSQFTPNPLSQQQHLSPPINPLVISRSSLTLARLTTTSPSMRRSLLTSPRQHTCSSLPSMGRRLSRFTILISQLTRSSRHTTHRNSLLTQQKKNPKRVFNFLQHL